MSKSSGEQGHPKWTSHPVAERTPVGAYSYPDVWGGNDTTAHPILHSRKLRLTAGVTCPRSQSQETAEVGCEPELQTPRPMCGLLGSSMVGPRTWGRHLRSQPGQREPEAKRAPSAPGSSGVTLPTPFLSH